MKIVVISDTHGDHAALGPLSGDVLIHCGDVEHLFRRDPQALSRMDAWFGQQDFAHILCIGGNHDLTLEAHVGAGTDPFRNATFLHDSAAVIDGVTFHGAPWVPQLRDHAFFADDDALRAAWAAIPAQVDVLITHTPPAGILDVSSRGLALGCPHLARRVMAVRPALHCFGHVHAGAGRRDVRGTTYVNASSVDSGFRIARPPVVIDFPRDVARRGRWHGALWPFGR
ncbi:metallophosphatase domain-containing protein [Tateyamaria sp. SN6-1]|uniref:metallophosphatase domain-containing protein n=1 Tax=Tateyamaria sp. SN6-1 TaxID=3092148 RepID=UPI0039F61687